MGLRRSGKLSSSPRFSLLVAEHDAFAPPQARPFKQFTVFLPCRPPSLVRAGEILTTTLLLTVTNIESQTYLQSGSWLIMADRLDATRRSRLMKRVGTKNTGPEKIVRSLLHQLGYRFRLHRKDLPGTPDIVFSTRRLALFVHGCFWHAHGCAKGQPPKSRLDYWGPKLAANRVRDARARDALTAAGWHVAVVWQCELKDRVALAARLRHLIDDLSMPDKPARQRQC